MSHKEVDMKKRLVIFFKNLFYVSNIVPGDEASRKCSEQLVEPRVLMVAKTKVDMKVIFGKLSNISIFLCFLSLSITFLYDLSIVICIINQVCESN